MLKYCLTKWDTNREVLKNALLRDDQLGFCGYEYIVKQVVRYILNDGTDANSFHVIGYWNAEKIVEIDHGDYQGTLLYVIPLDTYQPSDYEYLMTSVGYGSCSGCDTLQHLQCFDRAEVIDQYMALCKDIVTNMVHPFGCGWRQGELDEVVELIT